MTIEIPYHLYNNAVVKEYLTFDIFFSMCKSWRRDFGVHCIEFPYDMCLALLSRLVYHTRSMPLSLRHADGFNVSMKNSPGLPNFLSLNKLDLYDFFFFFVCLTLNMFIRNNTSITLSILFSQIGFLHKEATVT